jgi:hypothetical protein
MLRNLSRLVRIVKVPGESGVCVGLMVLVVNAIGGAGKWYCWHSHPPADTNILAPRK